MASDPTGRHRAQARALLDGVIRDWTGFKCCYCGIERVGTWRCGYCEIGDALEAALAAAEAPPKDGEASYADVARLTEQALAISQILAHAGIGGGTSLVEGVRQLWVQRDDWASRCSGDAEGRAADLSIRSQQEIIRLLREQLENEQRKERIAVKMATRAADLMAEAQQERDRAIEAAKAAVEAANNAKARAEGRVGLLVQALDQAVCELDDILDQKGHTARTRDVLAQARAVAKEVINGR